MSKLQGVPCRDENYSSSEYNIPSKPLSHLLLHAIIEVQPRSSHSLNKTNKYTNLTFPHEYGIARVLKCHCNDNTVTHVDVKYLHSRRKEFRVPINLCVLTPHHEDPTDDSDHDDDNSYCTQDNSILQQENTETNQTREITNSTETTDYPISKLHTIHKRGSYLRRHGHRVVLEEIVESSSSDESEGSGYLELTSTINKNEKSSTWPIAQKCIEWIRHPSTLREDFWIMLDYGRDYVKMTMRNEPLWEDQLNCKSENVLCGCGKEWESRNKLKTKLRRKARGNIRTKRRIGENNIIESY